MILLAAVALVLLAIGMAIYAAVRPVSAQYKAALILLVTVAAVMAAVVALGLHELNDSCCGG